MSADENNSQTIANGIGPVALLMFTGNTVNNELIPYANDTTDPNFDTGGNYDKTTYKYTIDDSRELIFWRSVD